MVYRAGPLAALGHDHVIVNRHLGGTVRSAATPAESSFALAVPVAAFLVDLPEARREEGENFQAEISEEAKAGTLRNMLGSALLDAAQYPEITLASERVYQRGDTWRARVRVRIAGRESSIDLPFELERDADRITARGTATLRQSELGLAPFSVMLGALQVRDDVTVKFRLVAVPP